MQTTAEEEEGPPRPAMPGPVGGLTGRGFGPKALLTYFRVNKTYTDM